MKKRKLGRTGISVSELCFGTMNFGWTIDRETAFALLDAYHAAGGSFFQSIHVCPALPLLPETFEAPEKWVGDWLRARSIARSQVVLSTRLTLAGSNPGDGVKLAGVIRRCCETSIRRLGVSYLDFLVWEWTKDLLPIDDALRAFDTLIEAGFVRHVAIANMPLWRVMEAIGRSAARGRRRFEALQTEYNILTWPAAREETEDLCESYHMGLLVTSALGGTSMNLRDQGPVAGFRPTDEPRRDALESLRKGAAARNASVQQAALSWVLSNARVSSVVISPKSPDQLDGLLDAASWSPAHGAGGPGEPITSRESSPWEPALSRQPQEKCLAGGRGTTLVPN